MHVITPYTYIERQSFLGGVFAAYTVAKSTRESRQRRRALVIIGDLSHLGFWGPTMGSLKPHVAYDFLQVVNREL